MHVRFGFIVCYRSLGFHPVNHVHPAKIISFVIGYAILKSDRVVKDDCFAIR